MVRCALTMSTSTYARRHIVCRTRRVSLLPAIHTGVRSRVRAGTRSSAATGEGAGAGGEAGDMPSAASVDPSRCTRISSFLSNKVMPGCKVFFLREGFAGVCVRVCQLFRVALKFLARALTMPSRGTRLVN